MGALHIHESHNIVKDKPWSKVCSRCAIRVNQSQIEKRCAANANYPEPYDGPMWKDAGPLSDDEDENVKHLIRGQRVTWAEYDETIDLKKAAEHIREGLGNSGLEDVQIDSMTYWVRAYFLGSLDKVEERNGKTVWPSQSEATEAAIRGAVQVGIHGEITFKTDYDISDGLDCVLIEWKTT